MVYMDANKFDGLAWIKNYTFSNGNIEVDIKGTNNTGQSFVGIAFHGLNDSTFDAVYFRPFNFDDQNKLDKTVQYISEPVYYWKNLREQFPGVYENKAIPVPEPEEWFHATIEIQFPMVKVYVNNATEPSLIVKQLSKRKQGYVGFWVGYGSDGWFKNLSITPAEQN